MEGPTATSVKTTVDEPSAAVDEPSAAVDEPMAAVDKGPDKDGNDVIDNELPTFDVNFVGIRHNVWHASYPLDEIVKPISKTIQHTKDIKNLRSLLQDQLAHCGEVGEVGVQEDHHLPDHEGSHVKLNKEISALLTKALGWEKEMDAVMYRMALVVTDVLEN
ncbi:MAG: hypothetical protein Q9212_006047 [Teloschistes hypoglaucus]